MIKPKVGMTHPRNRLIVFASLSLLILSCILLALLFIFTKPPIPLEESIQTRINDYNHGESLCENSMEYNDYLAETVNVMLHHPQAKDYSLSELESLFTKISHQRIDIITGNEHTSALVLQSFFYETCLQNSQTSAHQDIYMMIDDMIRPLGSFVDIYDIRWIEDRWVWFSRSGDEAVATLWQQQLDTTTMILQPFPFKITPPTINYIDAYRTIMLDYVDSSTKAPCKFNNLVNFFSNEEGVQVTYTLIDNVYTQIDANYRNIQIWTKDNITHGESIPVDNWQDYCLK